MFSLFKRQDWWLNLSLFGLVIASLVMLYSISVDLFFQQLGWAVLGIILIFLFAHIDWRSLVTYRWVIAGIYAFSILLLILTFFFAPAIRGVRAWLVLGPIQFQVSELVKLSLIILFAYFFSRQHIGIGRLSTIVRPFIYFLIPAILIFLQPDLGTVLILFGIWFGFLLISGLRVKHIALALIILLVLGFFAWTTVLQPYQKDRIVGLFNPNYDPLGVNYSTIQSKIAIGSGSFLGKGFQQGTQVQLGFLPEAATDYIFSSLSEEWGLLGSLVVILLFLAMIARIIVIGLRMDNNFYRFICLGAAIMFLIQFTVNMGSALALLPVIGVTFPFLSYGGSSFLINAIIIGIVQSGAAYRSLS